MNRNQSATGCASYFQARLHRRAFLQASTLGALGLSLSDYLGMQQAQGATTARAKSIILIYTMGGISHHDSFDPKPDAPAEIRGEFKTIPTKLPSIRFSDMIPRLAKAIDKYALIRSVQHNQMDHGVGAYYMLRGYTQPDPSLDRPENQLRANPCIGAHVARLLGSSNGLPPYMVVPGLSYLAQIGYYTAGWMGRAYDPFVLRSDANLPDFKVTGLTEPADVPPPRMRQRISLYQAVDRQCRLFEASPAARGMSTNYHKAYSILSSDKARRAFDLNSEPDRVREAYGRSRLGQGCLLGRRLVEAGVPFVTVDDDAWDHHANVFPGLRQRLPELDRCLPALLTDLEERGLLKTTLVALLTDFGRTPVINKSAGRDHWPGVFSVLFAGAGISGGQVIGASDKIGGLPAERRITPKDTSATIYNLLGIDPFQDYYTTDGRPMKVLDAGEVIHELV
ncbi:MAG TPA: DUF1501 domain-containing protein [Gemmataceae bacterium]|nr:DUF1501 domain-containing protein [Gemmataceae bacterium]